MILFTPDDASFSFRAEVFPPRSGHGETSVLVDVARAMPGSGFVLRKSEWQRLVKDINREFAAVEKAAKPQKEAARK